MLWASPTPPGCSLRATDTRVGDTGSGRGWGWEGVGEGSKGIAAWMFVDGYGYEGR